MKCMKCEHHMYIPVTFSLFLLPHQVGVFFSLALYSYFKLFNNVLSKYVLGKTMKTENNRRSHRRCSVRKGVLRNFAKFAGKHLR